jgi:hypothetical protein
MKRRTHLRTRAQLDSVRPLQTLPPTEEISHADYHITKQSMSCIVSPTKLLARMSPFRLVNVILKDLPLGISHKSVFHVQDYVACFGRHAP